MTPARSASPTPGAVTPGGCSHPPPEATSEKGGEAFPTGEAKPSDYADSEDVGTLSSAPTLRELARESKASRRNAQVAPSPGGASVQDVTPRLLEHRADALVLAYQGQPTREAVERLRAAGTWAAMQGTPVALDVGEGVSLEVSPRSREGWWHLSSDEVTAVVDVEGPGGWTCEVRSRALLLGRFGHETARDVSSSLAGLLLGRDPGGERARRLDLEADFDGFDLDSIARQAWIAGRARIAERVYAGTFARGPELTGFTIGAGGALLVRVYDKTEELRLPANAGPKRQEQQARWTERGWLGDPVVRVESQCRGELLDQLDMREPDALFANLAGLWRYVTESWCRLAVPGSSARRARWRLDPRWRAVQGVRFADEAQAVRRMYIRGDPGAARLASQGLTVLAADAEAVEGALALCQGKPRNALKWQEKTAARTVRALLTGQGMGEAFDRARATWADELIQQRGGPAALCYVLERMRAASARHASLVPLLQERAAVSDERLNRRETAA